MKSAAEDLLREQTAPGEHKLLFVVLQKFDNSVCPLESLLYVASNYVYEPLVLDFLHFPGFLQSQVLIQKLEMVLML